ncbi:hypothetical protein GCM10010862_10050 [Devosia nitrariae]|uniref:Glycosyl transferase family 25 domain-containing protein n=1 Tax=Devosia nitrariae TaxID=2071872 RepID=A0ABQ5W209_9HYPH|nr:hypothetical protein GCM10010862_10050 [Devosia nitrariae]
MLPIFYINLASRPDRREYMERQFAALNLNATRIEAVTAADISSEDATLYCNSANPTFLRRNELACTRSHERAWHAILDGGYTAALILEDDAELSPLLPAFLAEAAAVDAELIRIETTGSRMRVFPVISTGPSGVSVRPFRSTPMGAAGYILRASALDKLLGNPELRRRHLDLALYNPFEQPGASLSRVVTDPALCRQLGLDDHAMHGIGRSDIAHDLVPHVYAEKHPLGFRWFKFRTGLGKGLRNVIDDFAQRSKGLERRVIPFRS